MKLTAEKLKELIKEEIQEAFRDKYGQPKSPNMVKDRMARDIYHRTNPELKPSYDGDYQHPSDEEAMESHGKAMADAIASIQKEFGLGSFAMKVSGEKAEKIVDAIKKANSNASIEVEKTKGK
jgi:hypothetical protein